MYREISSTLVLSIIGCGISSNPRPASSSETANLQLEVTPQTDPVAISITLQGENISSIRFSPSRLIVVGSRKGKLEDSRIQQIREKLSSSEFEAAIRVRKYTGEGLSSGDQVRLSLIRAGDSRGVFGFLDNMPSVLKSVVSLLLAAEANSVSSQAAADYLRAEPVDDSRFAHLRGETKFRPVQASDFSGRPQTQFGEARRQPFTFQPLTKEDYRQWLERTGNARQAFVLDGGKLTEITLYESASVSN